MKDIDRRGWAARIIGAVFNAGIGLNHFIHGADDGTYIIGIFQFGLAGALLTGHLWMPQVIRWIVLHSPKWERKQKVEKVKKPKEPSMLVQKIKSTHDIYCPPIFFVEPVKPENLK